MEVDSPIKKDLPKAVKACVEAALDKKAEDLIVLDLSPLTAFTEYFIIMQGNSSKQNSAVYQNIERELKNIGRRPLSIEGKSHAEWVLMDYGEFIVHIFTKEARDYYSLEKLWGDAARMTF